MSSMIESDKGHEATNGAALTFYTATNAFDKAKLAFVERPTLAYVDISMILL